MAGKGGSPLIRVACVLLLGALLFSTLPLPVQGASTSNPIVVEGDDGFESAGFSGAGTPDDPFLLQDKSVNANQKPHGIKVANTTKHFIIRGCTVTDATTTDRDALNISASGSGIILYNVRNGTITGFLGQSNIRGITVASSQNVSVSDSRFADNRGAGVYLKDCVDGSITVRNSTFFKTLEVPVPVGVLVEDCQGARVENNSIQRGTYGIRVLSVRGESAGNWIIGNQVSQQETAGIFLDGNYPTFIDVVSGNTVQVPGGTGILIGIGTNGTVQDNTVSGCIFGIRVSGAGNEVRGNSVSNNTRGIILELGADRNLILENSVVDGAFGIEVSPSQGNQVLNNTIRRIDRESSSVGILLGIGAVRDALVQGNLVSHCTVGVRSASTPLQPVKGVTIAGNVIEGSLRQGAYLIYTRDSQLLNNSFLSGGGSGVYLGVDCVSLLLEGNLVANNTGYGLEMRGAAQNTVTRNVFDRNVQEGIFLDTGSGNVFHGNAFLFNKDSGRQYSSLRPQAYCGGDRNNWSLETGNLWADWLSPDEDEDGIVDLPYVLSGGCQDPLPLTSISGLVIPADITPPTVVAYAPQGRDVEQGSAISVTFSEDMNTSSVMVRVNNVSANGTWNDRTFVLNTSLQFETDYVVAVTGEDLSGNVMAQHGWTFRTEDRDAQITGRVVDLNGQPISGALLRVGEQESLSNVEGRFSMLLSPGVHIINISAEGYLDQQYLVTVEEGGDADLGDITLERAPGEGTTLEGLVPYIGLITIIILAAAALMIWRRRK